MIAGYGFTRWAWEEAMRKTWYRRGAPYERGLSGQILDYGPTAEYYRTIDRAWSAWLSTAPERSAGICPRVKV